MSGTLALPTYNAIYSFGDSLSDAGNLSTSLLGYEPVSPPYYKEPYSGTIPAVAFSNGPVWVQDLSIALGLGTLKPSLLDGNDFAYGGAETGSTPQNASNTGLSLINLPSQAAQFYGAGTTKAQNAGALFTVSIGSNDVLDILSNTALTAAQQAIDINDAVTNEIDFIGSLELRGAKNFLVLNVPDLGATPDVIDGLAGGGTMLASQLSLEYDNLLSSDLGSIAAADTLDITIVNALTLIDDAVAAPSIYQLTNVNTPVWNNSSGSFSSDTGTFAATGTSQDQFLFFDHLHPTERGQQAVAALAEADLVGAPAPCYAAGTQIATRRGDVPVERLRIGDRVLLARGGSAPVVWLGHRRVDCRGHACPADVTPVRVAADAFAPGQPGRTLWLSPDHAVFAEGVLIPVRHLVNGASITQPECDAIEYWHVALPQHEVILAEGLPCESYLDTGNRQGFRNDGKVVDLHPPFRDGTASEAIWEAHGCAPLRIAGEAVARVAARLERRPGRRRSTGATADLSRLLQPGWYLANHPDVAAAGLDPAEHYAHSGRLEGRLPCPPTRLLAGLGLVDPLTVAVSMGDVVARGGDPVAFFCRFGWQERRRPNPYFETGWYLDRYAIPPGMNPLLHYVLLGEAAGLAPGRHFDPAWYRQRYGLAPSVSALAHYLAHRRTQQFSPLPGFDVAAYRDGSVRPGRDPYAHALAARWMQAAA